VARIYLDHNVRADVADLLQAHGHVTTRTRDLKLTRARDHEQLLTAARRGTILVSHNYGDFELLHDAWRLWSEFWGVTAQHAGVLLVPQERPSAEQADAIAGLLAQIPSLANELYRWRAGSGWQRRG